MTWSQLAIYSFKAMYKYLYSSSSINNTIYSKILVSLYIVAAKGLSESNRFTLLA